MSVFRCPACSIGTGRSTAGRLKTACTVCGARWTMAEDLADTPETVEVGGPLFDMLDPVEQVAQIVERPRRRKGGAA